MTTGTDPWAAMTYGGRAFEDFFPDKAISRLLQLMAADDMASTRQTIRHGLHQVLTGFLSASADKSEFGSKKAVYKTIAKVATNAERLAASLLELQAMPNGRDKLFAEIQGLQAADDSGKELWAAQRRDAPFYHLLRVLADVIEAAERAQDFEVSRDKVMELLRSSADLDELDKALSKGEVLDRSRVSEFQTADDPVAIVVAFFHPTWIALSPLAYTEGEYFKELGRYNSNAIEALSLIFDRLDISIAASAIANEFRKWRKKQPK